MKYVILSVFAAAVAAQDACPHVVCSHAEGGQIVAHHVPVPGGPDFARMTHRCWHDEDSGACACTCEEGTATNALGQSGSDNRVTQTSPKTSVVETTMEIEGETVESFDETKKLAFRASIATVLGVPVEQVEITVRAVTAGGRRLTEVDGIAIDVRVKTMNKLAVQKEVKDKIAEPATFVAEVAQELETEMGITLDTDAVTVEPVTITQEWINPSDGDYIALYNRKFQRFIRMSWVDGHEAVSVSNVRETPTLAPGMEWEKFKVCDGGENTEDGVFGLWSSLNGRMIQMNWGQNKVSKSQKITNGVFPEAGHVWGWENFAFYHAENGDVALYNKGHRSYIQMTADSVIPSVKISNSADPAEIPADILEDVTYQVVRTGAPGIPAPPAPLANGKIVALWNPTAQRFVSMQDQQNLATSDVVADAVLPESFTEERFEVVQHGSMGEISLWSPVYKRYWQLWGSDKVTRSAVFSDKTLPANFQGEKFMAVDLTDDTVVLYHVAKKRFVSMDAENDVIGRSEQRNDGSLPTEHASMIFKVVDASFSADDTQAEAAEEAPEEVVTDSCPACTVEQCAAEQCATGHFVCTDLQGPYGGCNAAADFWVSAPDCNTCCDTSACDTLAAEASARSCEGLTFTGGPHAGKDVCAFEQCAPGAYVSVANFGCNNDVAFWGAEGCNTGLCP